MFMTRRMIEWFEHVKGIEEKIIPRLRWMDNVRRYLKVREEWATDWSEIEMSLQDLIHHTEKRKFQG